MGLIYDMWHRKSSTKVHDDMLTQTEQLQSENDQLLDEIEALKLDVNELKTENQRLSDQLNHSQYHRALVKTSIGLAVLLASYVLFNWLNESANGIVLILLIEAIFMFMMLRGEEK